MIKNFSIAAHSSSLTSVDLHPHIPGLLMTTVAESTNQLRIWDIYSSADMKEFKTSLVESKDLGAGKVYCGEICEDDAYYLAIGGSAGDLTIWNMTESKSIKKRFHGRSGRSGVVRMDLEHAVVEGKKVNLESSVDQDMEEDGDEDEDQIELEETLLEMRTTSK
jgi:WD40 repeat protein